MSKKSDLAYGYLLIFALVIYFISEYFIIIISILVFFIILYFFLGSKSSKSKIEKPTPKKNNTDYSIEVEYVVDDKKYSEKEYNELMNESNSETKYAGENLILNDLHIDKNYDGEIEISSYLNNKRVYLDLSQVKEVIRNVYIGCNFKIKPLKKKIKVGNYILNHVQNKKMDIDFFKKYFEFNKIQFFDKKGNSREINLEKNIIENHYEYITITNDKEYSELLKQVDSKGILYSSLRIEVALKQKKCLESLYGIKVIAGNLFILNPYFKDMGDIESVKSLEIRNYKKRSAIDLKNLSNIDSEYGLHLSGKIKSFGKLEIINGDLDLNACDFFGYDNIKTIQGDLRIKHRYKSMFNIPNVNGKKYHKRENKLLNFLTNNFNQYNDYQEIRRKPNKIKNLYKKTLSLIENKKIQESYDIFNKIKYPDNIIFTKKGAYKDFDKKIKNPYSLRCDGFEIWLLYYYKKNILEIDSNFILKLCGFSDLFTEIGKQYIDDLRPFLDSEINDVKISLFDSLDFQWIDDYFIEFLTHKISNDTYHFDRYEKYTELRNEISYQFKDIILNAENNFRESNGIKRVGEFWKSETELFYKIKEMFSGEEIIQHGQPSWLGEQHLDIYFSIQNIGIEYHGRQHFEPIDFFGGEEGFKKNVERDQRKKKLCEKNSCHLIIVQKGYDIDELKKKIEDLINK